MHVRAATYAGATAVRDEMQQLLAARANIKNALRLTLNNGTTALITEDSVLRLTAPAEFS